MCYHAQRWQLLCYQHAQFSALYQHSFTPTPTPALVFLRVLLSDPPASSSHKLGLQVWASVLATARTEMKLALPPEQDTASLQLISAPVLCLKHSSD